MFTKEDTAQQISRSKVVRQASSLNFETTIAMTARRCMSINKVSALQQFISGSLGTGRHH
jgi:hypothetical protein